MLPQQILDLSDGLIDMFDFDPETWGRWTHFDEQIFQMGWGTNHQLLGGSSQLVSS